VRIAHVRERHAPAGAPWRLAAALDGELALHWVDLEIARRRAISADRNLEHDSALHRQPITTLDDHLARGLRVEALAEVHDAFHARGGPDEDDAVLESDELRFGPPILRPGSFRDFYAFEQHVRTMWERRGGEVPEAWYRMPIFYFSNVSEIRGPEDPVWAPGGSVELDFELEVGALIDTPATNLAADRGEEAIGGYFVLNDWSARDLQRDESVVRLGPAKGKDFATSIGPYLVTPDELVDARATDATAPELAMTATVRTPDGTGMRTVAVSSGSWASARFSFGEMVARASADVRLRPGDILGSGTVGTGCLLEVREQTLGRYLEPFDEVTIVVDRLGELRTPIVTRPEGAR
jgi:fumarylacetoacetate (FAA) hydrolase